MSAFAKASADEAEEEGVFNPALRAGYQFFVTDVYSLSRIPTSSRRSCLNVGGPLQIDSLGSTRNLGVKIGIY